MPVFRQSDRPHVWDKSGLSGYLVCLVHLVSLMPPHKPDRPNRPHEQDRLVDFFSILLESAFWKVAFRGGAGQFAVLQAVSHIDHNADGGPDDESNPEIGRAHV